jgi:hypothetical protein
MIEQLRVSQHDFVWSWSRISKSGFQLSESYWLALKSWIQYKILMEGFVKHLYLQRVEWPPWSNHQDLPTSMFRLPWIILFSVSSVERDRESSFTCLPQIRVSPRRDVWFRDGYSRGRSQTMWRETFWNSQPFEPDIGHLDLWRRVDDRRSCQPNSSWFSIFEPSNQRTESETQWWTELVQVRATWAISPDT